MKKILYSVFALALALPMSASAATFSFTPVSGVFTPGKTFSTVVSVNPKVGEKITTAKMDLTFPANLVEVVSFKQASGWVPLAVPGYDLVNNTKGELIKSGGFPSKVTSQKEFGTIVFKIKAPGVVMVQTTKDSVLLDSANVNKYSASSYFKFTAVKPAPAKPKVKPPVKHKAVLKPIAVKKTVSKPVVRETKKTPDTLTTQGQTANVAGSATTTESASTTESATATTTESVNTSNGLFSAKTITFTVIFLLLVIGWLFFLKKKRV